MGSTYASVSFSSHSVVKICLNEGLFVQDICTKSKHMKIFSINARWFAVIRLLDIDGHARFGHRLGRWSIPPCESIIWMFEKLYLAGCLLKKWCKSSFHIDPAGCIQPISGSRLPATYERI